MAIAIRNNSAFLFLNYNLLWRIKNSLKNYFSFQFSEISLNLSLVIRSWNLSLVLLVTFWFSYFY